MIYTSTANSIHLCASVWSVCLSCVRDLKNRSNFDDKGFI